MRKLPEVQQAKELMNDAISWSVFTWMLEKSRVRETADQANAALDRLERATKARWSDEVKAEYKKLSGKTGAVRGQQKGQQPLQTSDPQIRLLIEKVVEADSIARHARMDAEKTFDEAERQLNKSLAQEGCKKAIHSWELHEKAIRKAEAVLNPAEAGA
jgi:hypothetical protein